MAAAMVGPPVLSSAGVLPTVRLPVGVAEEQPPVGPSEVADWPQLPNQRRSAARSGSWTRGGSSVDRAGRSAGQAPSTASTVGSAGSGGSCAGCCCSGLMLQAHTRCCRRAGSGR